VVRVLRPTASNMPFAIFFSWEFSGAHQLCRMGSFAPSSCSMLTRCI
jgi:hypothetical protein